MTSQKKLSALNHMLTQIERQEVKAVKKWRSIQDKHDAAKQQSEMLLSYMDSYQVPVKSDMLAGFYHNNRNIVSMVADAKQQTDYDVEQLSQSEQEHYLEWVNLSKQQKIYQKLIRKTENAIRKQQDTKEAKHLDEIAAQKYIKK